MSALIEVDSLKKRFGALTAVDGVSLTVGAGEVLGFLGPNGAGKSTTMKMISGFLDPDSGRTQIAGHDVQKDAIAARRQLGYLPEGAPAYGEMTPRGFLSFIAEVRGFRGQDARQRIDGAVEKSSLADVLDQPIETLSKGYKRRVGIAQAILHDPVVLIMDEPTDGLDPNQKHQVRELIKAMAHDKAIIISTHILEEVEAVCTRAIVIAKGRIVAGGTSDELIRRAPHHGSVAIKLAASRVDDVKQALRALSSVAAVEMISGDGPVVQLRVVPREGTAIAGDVAQALRDRAVAVDELYVERGRLDDVFRGITQPAQGPGHA